MYQDIHATHTFEVPLFEVPSDDFLETMQCFSMSQTYSSAFIEYVYQKLFFSFVTTDGKIHTCTVKLFPDNFPKLLENKLLRQISVFASKFNCAMCLKDKDEGYQMTINISNPSSNDFAIYDMEIQYILKVTIIITSLPVEMALNNFFVVIDSSPSNEGKK